MLENQASPSEDQATFVTLDKKQKKAISYQLIAQFATKYYPSIEQFLKVAGILAGGVGVVANIWVYFIGQIHAEQIRARKELSTYSSYGDFLKKYEADIQPATGTFLKEIKEIKQKYQLTNLNDLSSCKALIEKDTNSKTGMELFNSSKYANYRKIHNFYESLGLSLDKNLINFETVFDLFVFPAYWDLDKPEQIQPDYSPDYSPLSEFRNCIGKSWFGFDEKTGESRELPDFADYLNQLGYNYYYFRLEAKYNKQCKGQDKYQGTQCVKIQSKIEKIKNNKNITKSWQRLYPDICHNNLFNKILDQCQK